MNDNYEQECCSFWLLEYPENVINFSPSIIKLLGYKPEDLGSFPDFMDHVHPDDKRFIEDSFYDLFQGKSDKYKARYRIKMQVVIIFGVLTVVQLYAKMIKKYL
jgi:PAS domain-containing protein